MTTAVRLDGAPFGTRHQRRRASRCGRSVVPPWEFPLARPEPVPAQLEIALGVLGVLPSAVIAVTADASHVQAEVLATEDGLLRVATAVVLESGAGLTLVVGDGQRAGFEIDCIPASVEPEGVMRLAVMDVRRVKPRRRHARVDVSESALVRPVDVEAEVDVRVVDVGPNGVAFVSERRLAVGDSLSGMLNIGQRAFPIQVRVVHTQSLGFGRTRTGCQFTRIAEADRRLLDEVAMQAPIDRRSLRAIEVAKNGASRGDPRPTASLENVEHLNDTTALPTPRYCRPCGRTTLHHDRAAPGLPQDWRCQTCP